MSHFVKSFKDAVRGIACVWKEERNFRIESIVGILIVGLAFYFDFSFSERAFLLVAVASVLVAEIVNTALEDMCNKIEPSQDSVIGKIKDMCAGFVLVTALLSIALALVIFFEHFSI